MKRFWKIFLISLGSLLLLTFMVAGIALWFVFTPDRLTPIVEKQLGKFITCPAEIESVELTFFSSFPRLGLRADGISVLNPIKGAPCDTLLRVERLNAVIDVRAFLKRDELVLSDIVLKNGAACLYADTLGGVNYDILNLAPSDESATEEGGFTISYINADEVALQNIDILYVDDASLTRVEVKGVSATIKGEMKGDDIRATLVSTPFDIDFAMGRADSLIKAAIKGFALNATASMTNLQGDADVKLLPMTVTFAYGGEEYLKDGRIELTANVSADLTAQSATIRNSSLKLNGLEILLDGTLRNDTLRGVDMDMKYKLDAWPLSSVLALVPISFQSYLDGIEVSGNLSSNGTLTGIYGEGSMPMIEANLVFDQGRVSYPKMLPYPLSGILADLSIHTDLTDDAMSYVKINQMKAHTPKSALRASGMVSSLFSDPRVNIAADLNGDLADVAPFIPQDMKLAATGKASGRVKADVRMSQIERMSLEKMKVSGSVILSNLAATYDTISVSTPCAKLDFSLPNPKSSTRNTSFASLALVSDKFDASMGDSTKLSLTGAHLSLESSDVRDTLSIPAIVCDFEIAKLAGQMDDIVLSAVAPKGRLSMESGRRRSTVPRIKVLYNGGEIVGKMGSERAVIQKLDIDATVSYDESKEDIWQMLAPHGSVSAEGAVVNISALNYPVELPELAMNFTPLRFNVKKARIKLNESDFSLDGTLDNILPYFRGDSVLRGEFNFNSPVTDITQLLALTSGIGSAREKTDDTAADQFVGPYMVPLGVDITLYARIDKALWYGEDISDIKEFSKIYGDITIRNGEIFMTPELTFSSPVTDGNITLMYRTPRRNHLYAGTILHFTQIDIKEVLDLIPDLDSIMPMLKSFEGKAEFHFAMEGYMDSTYRFKLATLEGMCSISATDLLLKDEDVFRTVAKFMKYKDEGAIRVDTLAADFSVSGDVVTIFPFLFSVDRYKAVISGTHNLDMSFNYNVSLVQSPIPFRVGVDIKGDSDDLKFKVLTKSRYPDFYRPTRPAEVETREMEMRKQIRTALKNANDPYKKKE